MSDAPGTVQELPSFCLQSLVQTAGVPLLIAAPADQHKEHIVFGMMTHLCSFSACMLSAKAALCLLLSEHCDGSRSWEP